MRRQRRSAQLRSDPGIAGGTSGIGDCVTYADRCPGPRCSATRRITDAGILLAHNASGSRRSNPVQMRLWESARWSSPGAAGHRAVVASASIPAQPRTTVRPEAFRTCDRARRQHALVSWHDASCLGCFHCRGVSFILSRHTSVAVLELSPALMCLGLLRCWGARAHRASTFLAIWFSPVRPLLTLPVRDER